MSDSDWPRFICAGCSGLFARFELENAEGKWVGVCIDCDEDDAIHLEAINRPDLGRSTAQETEDDMRIEATHPDCDDHGAEYL